MLWDSTPMCLAQPPRYVTIRQSQSLAINAINARLKAANDALSSGYVPTIQQQQAQHLRPKPKSYLSLPKQSPLHGHYIYAEACRACEQLRCNLKEQFLPHMRLLDPAASGTHQFKENMEFGITNGEGFGMPQ